MGNRVLKHLFVEHDDAGFLHVSFLHDKLVGIDHCEGVETEFEGLLPCPVVVIDFDGVTQADDQFTTLTLVKMGLMVENCRAQLFLCNVTRANLEHFFRRNLQNQKLWTLMEDVQAVRDLLTVST